MAIIMRNDILSLHSLFHDVLDANTESQIDVKQIWNSLTRQIDYSPETSSHSFNGLKHLRERLHKMSGMLGALHALSSTFGEEMAVCESQVNIAALHHGLESVPEEVLSVILGCVVSEFKDAQDLSQVCTRFRTIVLSSPSIWAGLSLDTSMTSRQIATIVERSRGLLLVADLDLWHQRYDADVAEDILRHCSSLKELYVTWGNPDFVELFKSLNLPHLRLLNMSNEPYDHSYRFWTMPQLRTLEANFVPLPIVGCNLTRCDIDVDDSGLDALHDFLASVPLLEDLYIAFNATQDWQPTRTEAVILPNLKAMSVIVKEYASAKTMQSILDSLDLVKLSDLSVTLRLCRRKWYSPACSCDDGGLEDDECFGRRDALLSFVESQQSLGKLDVWIIRQTYDSDGEDNSESEDDSDGDCDGGSDVEGLSYEECELTYLFDAFDRMFTNPPCNLQELRMRKPFYDITIVWGLMQEGYTVPPILSLRICGIVGIKTEKLRSILRDIISEYPEIRSVEVVGCPETDEDELHKLFPNCHCINFI